MTEMEKPVSSQLSVQLYSLRDAIIVDRGVVLSDLAHLGFSQVEPFGLGDTNRTLRDRLADAELLDTQLESVGLHVTTAHCSVGADVDDLIQEAKTLRVETLIVPNPKKVLGFDAAIFEDPARIDAFADRMNELASDLSSAGINLGYHNHEFEWTSTDGQPGIDRLWSRLEPRIRAQVDIYWARVGGADVPNLLRGLADRLVSLHIKNGPAVRGRSQTPLTDGDVSVDAALAATPAGVDHVLEIDVTDLDRLSLLAMNADYLISRGWSHHKDVKHS